MINSFSGEYRFLSNFFPAPVTLDGVKYRTSEHAFQAAKTLDPGERSKIAAVHSAAEAKGLGQKVTLRAGWDGMRLDVMERLLRAKFSHDILKKWLLETGTEELVEGNTWKDTFWGVCNGVGTNHLGKLLMKIRAELQNPPSVTP